MKTPIHLQVEKSEEVKRWPQLLAAATASIVVFTTGFHTGWPAPFLPKLLSGEFPYKITNDEASYITIIGPAGNIVGGFVGTFLLDKIGRKKTLLLIAPAQLLSFFLIYMSYELKELLYVARFVGGFAEGAALTVTPLYIGEIAEPAIRGRLGTLMPLTCICGMLFVNVIGSYVAINTSALIFLVFPVVFLVCFWKIPDSPYYLLMKNRREEAEQVLVFFRGRRNVDEELNRLVKDVERQMSESGTFRDVFVIQSNRKAFTFMVCCRLIQQGTGVMAFSSYIQILLKEATPSLAASTGASIILVVQLAMTVLSTFFVDRWGRKPLMLFSTAGCCVNLFIQAIYFTLKDYTDLNVSVIDWFPLVMMILFMVLISVGLGVVVNIVSSEIFSTRIKSKAVFLVNIVFAGGMMATTKFYQTTADNFGVIVPYYSFALCTFLGVVFLYFCMPETKGKSLEEIQQHLKGNVK